MTCETDDRKYRVAIIGNGAFGSFFVDELKRQNKCDVVDVEDADSIVLAVPFDAYDEVTKALSGRHVINVCSIQEDSTQICLGNGCDVFGAHPLFGRRTEETDRRWIITAGNHLRGLNRKFMECVVGDNWTFMSGEEHDRLMGRTHLAYVEIMEKIKPMLGNLHVDDYQYAPPSFRRLIDLVDQWGDMPDGTLSSIKSNKYRPDGSSFHASNCEEIRENGKCLKHNFACRYPECHRA